MTAPRRRANHVVIRPTVAGHLRNGELQKGGRLIICRREHTKRDTVEVCLIQARELDTLQSFDSRGHITLSAYLPLDGVQDRESITDEFIRQVQARLAECRPKPECEQAIKEDVEIVEMYLKTNGHLKQAGLAIFSCAAELFWRAYPLTTPVPALVKVGPKFHVAPLREFVTKPN